MLPLSNALGNPKRQQAARTPDASRLPGPLFSEGIQHGRRARSGKRGAGERGSTFVIVLWIAFGLVSLTLYFAHSMSLELRASDNRVCGTAAEQAIEGAARYLSYILANPLTNGVLPDPTTYACEAVPVGDAHFWLIGRDHDNLLSPGQVAFGLVDEASKLNLNSGTSNLLVLLPRITLDCTAAILDWRSTNNSGAYQTYYGMQRPAYENKSAPFETIDELRLLYGADMDTLVGEDRNRNGVLDPNENDFNRDGVLEPGILEYVTVYSREPGTYSNGVARIAIGTVSGPTGPLASLLQTTLGASRADRILSDLGVMGGGASRGGPGNPAGAGTPQQFRSPLEFYRRSRMTPDEFAQIAMALRVTGGTNHIEGRININTASAAVLSCLPGLSDSPDLVQQLITYRQTNPDKLTSVAWLVDAVGQNNASVLDALQAGDYLTTESYQFTADIAALGPHGRGYRRVRFVFDTADGTPRIVFRQDLTHLGWALGKEVRQTWLTAKAMQ